MNNCCGLEHNFEETENGFKLEVTSKDAKKTEALKKLLKSIKDFCCPDCCSN